MKQPQMMTEIGKAKGAALDCRYGGVNASTAPPYYLSFYLDNALPSLTQGVITLGAERYLMHNGYPPQRGNSSGGYASSFATQTPGAIVGLAQNKKPLAVVIDEKTPNLLPTLSGLQAAGAKIAQVGKGAPGAGAGLRQMALPDGVRVNLRVTEFVHPNGGSTFQPDAQLTNTEGAGDGAITAAIAALNAPPSEKAAAGASQTAVTLRGQKDDPYPQMSFPIEEYRLLALFRLGNPPRSASRRWPDFRRCPPRMHPIKTWVAYLADQLWNPSPKPNVVAETKS